jgi:GST-like protein
MDSYTLLARPGWGSAITEAMLEIAGVPYRIEAVDPLQPGPARDRLLALNPLGQLPTVLLPDGTVMTESAAIALYLADRSPGLAPPADSPDRARFLRWLVFLVAAIYPNCLYGDFPKRFVSDEAASKELRASADALTERHWRQLEGEVAARPWFLASGFSALDIYVRVMTHWRPRRPWFEANCPKLFAIAKATDAEPRLAKVWARNTLA